MTGLSDYANNGDLLLKMLRAFLGWGLFMGCGKQKNTADIRGSAFRLAEEANSIEKRTKLPELARVWADAALVEEQAARRVKSKAA